MKRCLAFFLMTLGAAAAPLHAGPITLVNHGFEDGLNGWVSTGDVQALGPTSVVTFNNIAWDLTPNGTQMAALNSNPQPASSLDGFFGLPAGTLQGLNPTAGNLTDGSGIYQDFTGQAGDTVTMFFDYVARDYIPFNDPAFGVLVSPNSVQAMPLASIYGGGIEVGTAGNSGWRSVVFTLPEDGTHRIGFGLTNDLDQVLDSALFLDNAAGGSSTQNPGGLVPGQSPLFPVLPDSTPLPNQFVFNNPTPGLWYDPPFAEAYIYELLGGAEFSQFATPDPGFGFGDLTFTDLAGTNAGFVATPGTVYDVLPTSSFKISGLPFGLIDFASPGFATAFPAFLNWTGPASQLQITAVPFQQQQVPEPGTYALLTFGLGALLAVRRRR